MSRRNQRSTQASDEFWSRIDLGVEVDEDGELHIDLQRMEEAIALIRMHDPRGLVRRLAISGRQFKHRQSDAARRLNNQKKEAFDLRNKALLQYADALKTANPDLTDRRIATETLRHFHRAEPSEKAKNAFAKVLRTRWRPPRRP